MSNKVVNDRKICKMLLQDLMEAVKECQSVYGKTKTLLATEKDIRSVSKHAISSSSSRTCCSCISIPSQNHESMHHLGDLSGPRAENIISIQEHCFRKLNGSIHLLGLCISSFDES